jgi:hypothetical protein
MSKTEKDPSAVVVPFGKHKGATVAELLTKDPQYAEWVLAQGWVAERFAELHAAILTRGAVTDDTPEHNAMQVRFLSEEFQLAAILAARPGILEKEASEIHQRRVEWASRELNEAKRGLEGHERDIVTYSAPNYAEVKWAADSVEKARADSIQAGEKVSDLEKKLANASSESIMLTSSVIFEDRGTDVWVFWSMDGRGPYRDDSDRRGTFELKPTIGDDFPSVMREMQRLGARNLVVGTYTGRAVSEPDLRKMFEANGRRLVFMRDIEAELANAREIIAEGFKQSPIVARAAGDLA